MPIEAISRGQADFRLRRQFTCVEWRWRAKVRSRKGSFVYSPRSCVGVRQGFELLLPHFFFAPSRLCATKHHDWPQFHSDPIALNIRRRSTIRRRVATMAAIQPAISNDG